MDWRIALFVYFNMLGTAFHSSPPGTARFECILECQLLLQCLKGTALGRAKYSRGIVGISMAEAPYGSKGLVKAGLED